MWRHLLWSIIPCLLWAGPAQALRCGNRLVAQGDSAAQILERCGEPAYVDASAVLAAPYGPPLLRGEEWYYNFGPNRLVVVLTLQNGQLLSERTDGYGYSGDPPGRCLPTGLRRRQSKFHLLWHCGAPDERQAYTAFRPLRPRQTSGRFQPVVHEEWIYRFGDRYRARAVQIENGQVVDIDTID